MKELAKRFSECLPAHEKSGHSFLPFFPSLDWNHYRPCILHAGLTIGRIMCDFIRSSAVSVVLRSTSKENFWENFETQLFGWKLHIDFQTCPRPGSSWNINGKQSSILLHKWEEIAQFLCVEHTINTIREVRKIFQIYRIPPENLQERKPDILWLQENSQQIFATFCQQMGCVTDRNYIHEMSYEFMEMMNEHGLFVFSNDIQETMNYAAKCDWWFTNKGGSRVESDWIFMLMQRSLMRLHTLLVSSPSLFDTYVKKELKKLNNTF